MGRNDALDKDMSENDDAYFDEGVSPPTPKVKEANLGKNDAIAR
jgi:hypothetical protein